MNSCTEMPDRLLVSLEDVTLLDEGETYRENRDTQESSGGVFVDGDNYCTEFSSGVTNDWEIIVFLNHVFLMISSLKDTSRVS